MIRMISGIQGFMDSGLWVRRDLGIEGFRDGGIQGFNVLHDLEFSI